MKRPPSPPLDNSFIYWRRVPRALPTSVDGVIVKWSRDFEKSPYNQFMDRIWYINWDIKLEQKMQLLERSPLGSSLQEALSNLKIINRNLLPLIAI